MKNLFFCYFLIVLGLVIVIVVLLVVIVQVFVMQDLQEVVNNNQLLVVFENQVWCEQVMFEIFVDLVEQVSLVVVNIIIILIVFLFLVGGLQIFEGSFFSDLFCEFGFFGMLQGLDGQQMFFGCGGLQVEQCLNVLGLGFVVLVDGLIVINNYVIDGVDVIEIEFFLGKKLLVKVVGKDEKIDIVVLCVESFDFLFFVKFGDSDNFCVGDWVLVLGNLLGQGFLVLIGIVLVCNWVLLGIYDDFIQIDVVINCGNLGGLLFNMDGEVIGVNIVILLFNGGLIGIGFLMVLNVVGKVVEQFEEFGEICCGWLGVKIQFVSDDIVESFGFVSVEGVMVIDVFEGLVLDVGMKVGDVIINFVGGEVKDLCDLVCCVVDVFVGEVVDVIVQCEGKFVDLKIMLGCCELVEGSGVNVSDQNGEVIEDSSLEIMGMNVVLLIFEIVGEFGVLCDMQGLVVQQVVFEGVVVDKGLSVGDVIIEVGQQFVIMLVELEVCIKDVCDVGCKLILMMVCCVGELCFVVLLVQ